MSAGGGVIPAAYMAEGRSVSVEGCARCARFMAEAGYVSVGDIVRTARFMGEELTVSAGGSVHCASCTAEEVFVNMSADVLFVKTATTTYATLRGVGYMDAALQGVIASLNICGGGIPITPKPSWYLVNSNYKSSSKPTTWSLRGKCTSPSQPAGSTQRPNTPGLTG